MRRRGLQIGDASTVIRLHAQRRCAKDRWKKGWRNAAGSLWGAPAGACDASSLLLRGWKHLLLVPPAAQSFPGAFSLQPICWPRCQALSYLGRGGSVLLTLSCFLQQRPASGARGPRAAFTMADRSPGSGRARALCSLCVQPNVWRDPTVSAARVPSASMYTLTAATMTPQNAFIYTKFKVHAREGQPQ